MITRRLTGRFFTKRFLFKKIIMIETIQAMTCPFDLSVSPEFVKWEKATTKDLFNLGLKK